MGRIAFGSWPRIVLVASVCIAGIDVGAAGAQDRRRDIDTAFAFSKTGTVVIGNGSAEIVVNGWDQPTMRIRAHSDEGPLRIDASSSRAVIEPSRSGDDVVIQVMVPRGVRVVARTNGGDITVRETQGDVEAETSSGDVVIFDARDVDATNLSGDLELRQISGTIMATTNNGDVTIRDCRGNVEASSVSGDVSIGRATSKLVRAKTTNGEVSFEGTIAAEGRYEFVSHNGDIDLAIPKDAGATIGVATYNGTVDSEFPITLRPGFSTASRETVKRYTFTIGSGSARVTVETFSGDINITSRGSK